MSDRVTLGTRVSPAFSEAVAYFANRQTLSTSTFVREATKAAATETFKRLYRVYNQEIKLAAMMREAIAEDRWESLAEDPQFPQTKEEWLTQIEQYEISADDRLAELLEMQRHIAALEIDQDKETATAMTVIQTVASA